MKFNLLIRGYSLLKLEQIFNKNEIRVKFQIREQKEEQITSKQRLLFRIKLIFKLDSLQDKGDLVFF